VKQFYEYIAKTLDEIFVTVKSSLRRTAHALEENKNEYAVVSAKDIMDDSFKEKLQKKLIAEDMKQEKDHAMKILLKIYNADPTPSLKEYMSTCDIDVSYSSEILHILM
jgi:4-hydroxyphenylpyruvate dioxygenase-like putative hemolysin